MHAIFACSLLHGSVLALEGDAMANSRDVVDLSDPSRQGMGNPLTLPKRSSRSGGVITIQDSPVQNQGSLVAMSPDLHMMKAPMIAVDRPL